MDEREFSHELTEHRRLLCALAYARTGSWAAAEELAQEAVALAWERREQAQPGRVRPWLCGIVRRLAANGHRRGMRRERLARRDIIEPVLDPREELLAAERLGQLRAAVSTLPPRYRLPLVMHYHAQLSVAEIADALELRPAAVRQRLRRARLRLRSRLEKSERPNRILGVIAAIAASLSVRRALASTFAKPAFVLLVLTVGLVPDRFHVPSAEAAIRVPVAGMHSSESGPRASFDSPRLVQPDVSSIVDAAPAQRARAAAPMLGDFEPVLVWPTAGELSASQLSGQSPPAVKQTTAAARSVATEFDTARELYRRGLYHAALARFENIVRAGPGHRHHRATLPWLAAIATRVPDASGVAELMATYPPASLRSKSMQRHRSDADFLLGRYWYRSDLERARRHLAAVPAQSKRFVDAQALLAVVHTRRGKLNPAAAAYRRIVKRSAGRKGGAEARARALLGLGRLFYTAGKPSMAVDYLRQVPMGAAEWSSAVFESSWAFLREGNAARSLGQLHTLEAPVFDYELFPESGRVAATLYFKACHYRRAEAEVHSFRRRYDPVIRALESLRRRHAGDDAAFYRYAEKLWSTRRRIVGDRFRFATYAGRKRRAAPRFAARQLAAASLDARTMRRRFAAVAAIDAELARYARLGAPWKRSVAGIAALEDLTLMRSMAAHAAGRLARERVARAAGEVRAVRAEMSRIRLAILDVYADQGGQTTAREPSPRIFAVDDQMSYWPYRGEYWRDELGRYSVALESVCP